MTLIKFLLVAAMTVAALGMIDSYRNRGVSAGRLACAGVLFLAWVIMLEHTID